MQFDEQRADLQVAEGSSVTREELSEFIKRNGLELVVEFNVEVQYVSKMRIKLPLHSTFTHSRFYCEND